MKPPYFYLLLFISAFLIHSCNKPAPASREQAPAAYDSTLARQYGADAHGMKKYVLVFLKRGPNRPADSTKAARLQQAHMANIRRMADEGVLVLAGPFLDGGDPRGIYLFDVPTVEEARRLTESDPAVRAGSLIMELKPWYGSAALMAIPALHEKLRKE